MDTRVERWDARDLTRHGGGADLTEVVMWWILGFLAAMVLIAVVINRRGSTGASRADDLPSGGTATRPTPGSAAAGSGAATRGGGF